MRSGPGLLGLAGIAALTLPWAVTQGADPPRTATPRLPPLAAPYPLPPLPERSPRNANYTIEARLDPDAHAIEGSLLLEWRNTSDVALSSFPFHLYWNAFRNDLSTTAREERRWSPVKAYSDQGRLRRFGYIQVRSVTLEGIGGADLTKTLRYVQPDDGNTDDRTVMEVHTARPIGPGETARFRIAWTGRIPFGDYGRAGWVHDYHFVSQWFPKIGVFWKGQWNCHQFHATTEFFSDYGLYDVKLTLPKGHVVGATGALEGTVANADGTETFHFAQQDVHDFAWVASRRFLERKGRFEEPGYPPVDVRLLLQPEHAHLADRYIEATKLTLRSYGAWAAPYPYAQITVVDPAWASSSEGMEYPTLFTGGANVLAPSPLHDPENVTIHECGHQFWYGLVGNNEFEEAWLDEGFNTYHTAKAEDLWLGPTAWGARYFGPGGGRGGTTGWPVIAPGIRVGRSERRLSGLRRDGKLDVMARRGWEYRTGGSYGLNSYGKPALTLQTLEGLLGDETMTRILRTYARRFRFAHPTSEDFIEVVGEVTGKDYRWFFDQTWFSSDLCDYAIKVKNGKARVFEGFADGPGGAPTLVTRPPRKEKKDAGPYESEVTVERLGEVRMPVEVLVEFADGGSVRETWDGQDRWTRFKYRKPVKVRRAVVDPGGKLAIDVNPANNSWVDEEGVARRAALKWSARFLLWLQNLLELHAVLG